MSVVSGIVGAISGKKAGDAQAGAAKDAARVQQQMFDTTRDDLAPWRTTGENALAALSYETGLGARPTFGGSTTAAPAIQEFRAAAPAQAYRDPAEVTVNSPRVQQQQSPLQYRVAGKTFSDYNAAQKFAQGQVRTTPGQAYRGFEATPGYQFRVDEGTKAVERSAAARGGLNSGATQKALTRFGQGIASDEYNNYINRLAGLAGTGQSATTQTGALGAASATNQGNALLNAGAARASGYQAVGQGVRTGIQGIGQIAALGTGQGWFGSSAPRITGNLQSGSFY